MPANKKLQELFLAAKEQIFLCNSVVDEEIAYLFLQQKDRFLPQIQQKITENRKIVNNWMHENPCLEWIQPSGGVVCFPRIKQAIHIDIERFYHTLYHTHKTLIGPGHCFEMDKRYMGIGYGWPTAESLGQGLFSISAAIKESTS